MPLATYKNAAGFSAEKIELLEKDFAGLNESGSDLAERALRYVIDGDDANVLDALTKAHEPALQLRLIQTLRTYQAHRPASEARDRFFADIDAVGFEPYLRLAKVFEAAAKGGPPVHLQLSAYFAGLPWLELLMQEIRMQDKGRRKPAFPISLLEEMVAAEGQDSALLIKVVFSAEPQDDFRFVPVTAIKSLPGFAGSVLRHHGVVAEALAHADATRKIELLGILSEQQIAAAPFARELASLAISSAKKVREAALPLLKHARDEARPFIEQAAVNGTPTERVQAIRWLGRFAGEAAREFLVARQQLEKGAKLQEALGEALGELGQDLAPIQHDVPSPRPALPHVETVVPLSASARQAVAELIETYNQAAIKQNQDIAKHRQQHPEYAQSDLPVYDQPKIEETCRSLENLTGAAALVDGEPALRVLGARAAVEQFMAFARHPDVRLIHLLRLIALSGQISAGGIGRPTMFWGMVQPIREYEKHHPPGFTLLELAATLNAIGVDSRIIGYDLLSEYGKRFVRVTNGLADYFAAHLDLLEMGLDNQPLAGMWHYEWRNIRERTLEMIARFPEVPPALVSRIWRIAIGPGKMGRAAAQKMLARLSDLRQRLADALASGDYPTRVVAAQWLGRTREKYAAELLHKALKKEKQDAAKDAMLTALESLGESIERYLDRDQLSAEAERGLKKGLPKDLEWFPVHSWPETRWHDSLQPVPAEILNWFLTQTNKLGTPEAGALLRRYCQQFAADDRETLGTFVLTQWLAYDGRPKYTDAEARQLAKQKALATHQLMQTFAAQHPQMAQLTLTQWEESHYQEFSAQRLSTGIKQKGILALAAACGSDNAVTIAGEYVKRWYGWRAAQCRALIAMLASIDRPAAIQLLLSVANRFRTKSIREEAEKYVKIVAERKGWTIDELADRTVPAAGFEDDLTLDLDYGPRKLVARLRPDFSIELKDENGKPLKSLPEPRKDDDPEKAKAAKKTLSTAKSDLKKLVAQQTTRLYEAMCTERDWTSGDWQTYLLEHPVVGRLCQRLVWGVRDGTRIVKTFRPLGDGTLTDENDEQFVVPAGARLRLAHGSLVSPESSAAWTRHLADYEVQPLFTQFGRPAYVLPADKQDAAALTDFEGHLIEAFKLRGLAARLGYTRGPAQDGGWFYEYEKTLAGMGLKVVLRFSGNGMPEENRTVALMDLHFMLTGGEAAGMSFDRPGVPLAEVPGVLLSECHHDLATIAAAGGGYDADWQKTVGV